MNSTVSNWQRSNVMELSQNRFYELNGLIGHMSALSAMRWCEWDACGCLGCANRSGGLSAKGVTKEEWQAWWRVHLDGVLTAVEEQRDA